MDDGGQYVRQAHAHSRRKGLHKTDHDPKDKILGQVPQSFPPHQLVRSLNAGRAKCRP
jgi:hypothetical protein